jgi:uncharacterized protein (TIGR02118 family)
MHCLTVTYPTPDDPDHFRTYYSGHHIPLARTLPGLLSCQYGFPESMGRGETPFCIFQAFFRDAAAMQAALGSDVGAEVAADVPNYSPGGASLCHYEVAGS